MPEDTFLHGAARTMKTNYVRSNETVAVSSEHASLLMLEGSYCCEASNRIQQKKRNMTVMSYPRTC